MELCWHMAAKLRLNCGVNLDESGILKKYGVKVLGTQIPGNSKD